VLSAPSSGFVVEGDNQAILIAERNMIRPFVSLFAYSRWQMAEVLLVREAVNSDIQIVLMIVHDMIIIIIIMPFNFSTKFHFFSTCHYISLSLFELEISFSIHFIFWPSPFL
jgi:hypothetical protein